MKTFRWCWMIGALLLIGCSSPISTRTTDRLKNPVAPAPSPEPSPSPPCDHPHSKHCR